MTYQNIEISTSRERARLQRIFKIIHERKAQTLMTASGTLMLLPMLAQAQEVASAAADAATNIQSAVLQSNGSALVTLTNGQTIVVSASNVTVAANGAVILSEAALSEIAALSASTGAASGGVAAGLAGAGAGGAAAIGVGVLGLGAALGGGGSGGGGGGGGDAGTVSRTIQAIDAPLQNALVFYDTDRDGTPDQSEYLGLTDENGALDITYTPVPNASFIMIPAPVADDVGNGYGWTDGFTQQFADVVTRDIVTDNVFDQILSSPDTGGTEDAVLSPVSTLIDNGVPEETVRELLDLPEDLDIATFNFNEALASDDPALREAAENLSTAAVMLNTVVESAVAAASAETNLTPEEVVEVATRAIEDTVAVVNALPEDTPIEEVAYVATAVSTASALNPDVDTAAVVQEIEDAAEGGTDPSDAVDNEITDLVNEGTLSSEESATVGATAEVLERTTQAVEQVFENLPTDIEPEEGESVSDAVTRALEQTDLDDATDEGISEIKTAINEELLGIKLEPDSNDAIEGQTTLLEGNVLGNDAYSDGSDLPGETVLLEVNGVSVPAPEFNTEVTKDFALSTSSAYRYSWYQDDTGAWRYKRVGASTESAEELLTTLNFNGDFEASYDAADIASYFYDYYLERYTYYNQRYWGNRFTEEQLENFAGNASSWAERYYARFDFEPVDGSMIHQTVTVDAGTTLTFDYTFAGYDYLPFNDMSFFAVQKLDGSGNADGAGEILTGLDNGGLPDLSDVKGDELFNGVCVWQSLDGTYTYTFTEAGTYNIGIGATDVGRNGAKARLEVSNFQMVDGTGTVVPDIENTFQSVGNVSADTFAQTSETALFIQGYYGTLIISGEGDYVYQVGGINAEPIPEGDVVTDNFEYSIELPDGRIATQTLGVQVTGTEEEELTLPSVTIYSSDVNISDNGLLDVTGATGNADGQPVNIVVEDSTGATVTQSGIATNPDGTFEVEIDVSSLADGPLIIVGQVSDGVNLGQTQIEVELDQTINDGPVAISITETRADEVIFDLSGLADDETARVVFSDGENEVFQGIVSNGTGYSINISDLNGGAIASSRILITDDAGNTAEISGPSIFSPTIEIEPPNVIASNQDAYILVGSTDANPADSVLTITISDSDPTTPDVVVSPVAIGPNGAFNTPELDLSGLEDGDLSISAQIAYEGETYSQSFEAEMDTVVDLPTLTPLGGPNVPAFDIDDLTIDVEISGVEDGATGQVTVSDGVNPAIVIPFTGNGTAPLDVSDLEPGAPLTVTISITDAAGNTNQGNVPDFFVPTVHNVTANSLHASLAEAVEAAVPGDTLQLTQGTYDEDVRIDKPLTIRGFQAGEAAGDLGTGRTATLGEESLDEEDWAGNETVLNGTITIAASDVVIDGMTFGDEEQPLVWDENILGSIGGELDGFSLYNSIIVGVNSSGALRFNAGADPADGEYSGPPVASGWTISNNIIGGLLYDGENTGVLNIAGVDGAQITENVFWRPTASHIYASSMTNSNFADNYFLHGVHGGGADFDGFGEHFEAIGYGYGYGYGGSGSDDLYLGRNVWLELTGISDQVTIARNDGAFNSGGIQIFGEEDGFEFTNIYITENNFEQFVNADPEGVLGDDRSLSGFMGAIIASVNDGSTADGIYITDNTVEVAYDQIFSDQDNTTMVGGIGFINDLHIEDNQIVVVPTSSAEILAALADLGASTSTFDGAVNGVALAGGLTGAATSTGNTFIEGIEAQFVGTFIAPDPSELGATDFGVMSATVFEDNDTNGITGATSADVLLFGAADELDWSGFDNIASEVVILATEITEPDGSSQLRFGHVLFGTDGADTLTPGGGLDFSLMIGSEGNDTFVLNVPSNTGRNFVALEAEPADNGTDVIVGFTAGDPATVPDADSMAFLDITLSGLRGEGDISVIVDQGDELHADAGLLIFSNELTGGADAVSAVEDAVESLTGLADGDLFYVVADHTSGETTMYGVEFDAGEANVLGTMAVLQGVDVGTLTHENFDPFNPPEV